MEGLGCLSQAVLVVSLVCTFCLTRLLLPVLLSYRCLHCSVFLASKLSNDKGKRLKKQTGEDTRPVNIGGNICFKDCMHTKQRTSIVLPFVILQIKCRRKKYLHTTYIDHIPAKQQAGPGIDPRTVLHGGCCRSSSLQIAPQGS